jgi:hypothetical protein
MWSKGMTVVLLLSGVFTSGNSTFAAQGTAGDRQSVALVVQNGTHFLVRLDDALSTATSKLNKKFNATTLEPLETSIWIRSRTGREDPRAHQPD